MKILYIEDDPNIVALTRHMLRAAQHTVIHAENARDGMAVAYREMPDVILMDYHLPGVNGAQAVYMLKDHPRTRVTPIVGISAFLTEEVRQQLIAEGCAACISKPFTRDELVTVLESVTAK